MKKHIVLVAFFLISISTTIAQEWQTDFTVAKEIATKESKPIILVFQGSDWCAPCIKLDHQIWSTPAFKQYAKDNYVMLQADFPKRKKNALSDAQTAANAKLAETYNKNGIFPFVVVLNSNGKVLVETGYQKITPEDYIKELNSFTN
ncbi:thiol-disulfide isomerase [Polaribacter sejongensis]|uniref:Thiol-disulfide isomerase n=1 Tax=Polaribacter sejongensis TaxID=985043 RepID=A0ABM6Q1L5_9FLAO|nr:thioredoxin family protein [Polaribacter sejongensis]AUC23054.1 thiol-disulfide isomerase [Polaribacter sejongensis]